MMTDLLCLELYNLFVIIHNESTMCFSISTCKWFSLTHLQTIRTQHQHHNSIKYFRRLTFINVFQKVMSIEKGFPNTSQHCFTFENVNGKRHLAERLPSENGGAYFFDQK